MPAPRRRHIQSGVAIEEAYRLQREPNVRHRHNRPVFGTDDVVSAESIPDDDIGILERAIGPCVGGQPGAACVLLRVITRGETFARIVASDPEMIGDEATALDHARLGTGEWKDVFARHQLITHRLAEAIEGGWIDDRPVALRERVDDALSLGLSRQVR